MKTSGFTQMELIVALIIIAILAAVALPRLSGSDEFYGLGFLNETEAALRYAQKAAIAKQRNVCVEFTANSVTLRFASAYGSSACDANLVGPAGEDPYQVTARSNIAFSPTPSNFTFDRLGRPSAGQTISIAGARSIIVEAETGYVHP